MRHQRFRSLEDDPAHRQFEGLSDKASLWHGQSGIYQILLMPNVPMAMATVYQHVGTRVWVAVELSWRLETCHVPCWSTLAFHMRPRESGTLRPKYIRSFTIQNGRKNPQNINAIFLQQAPMPFHSVAPYFRWSSHSKRLDKPMSLPPAAYEYNVTRHQHTKFSSSSSKIIPPTSFQRQGAPQSVNRNELDKFW